MEDFASAAMMRLIVRGLVRQGLAPPPLPAGAHVQRPDKAQALNNLIARHGRLAALRLADAVPDMTPEPVVQALLLAYDAADLLDRWHRLEVFSHARHRLAYAPLAGGGFDLSHRARDDGPPPSEAETLLVLAVVTMLVEVTTGRAATLTDDAGAVLRADGVWQEVGPIRSPLRLTLSDMPSAQGPQRVGVARPETLTAVQTRLAADPVRRWTVAELACALHLSPRTLQRRLAEAGRSLSRLLAEARLETAARYLCAPDGPGLAQIGFLSGYSDQPHFTRSFTRAVGTTPASYRAKFSASIG